MVKGKGTSKPYVSFVGNSSIDVTGSMHLVRFKKYVTLLDCGGIQLNDPLTSYKANQQQLKKIKATEVDYIITSHPHHYDHGGLIPALFARGCQAHVYIPFGVKKFLKIMWEDSLKIMQQDCDKINHKHGLKLSPLYDEQAIERTLNRCIEVDYYNEYNINEDISFQYYPAGHIIHSAQVVLTLNEGFVKKRIGYTGDIGEGKRVYTEPRIDLPFVDLLIGENTYNQPTRPNKIKDRSKDIEKIFAISEQSNKILIPTFSLGRTQEILTLLYDMAIDMDMPIYLDSPLAQKICDIWDDEVFQNEIMKMPNLHLINSWAESQVLQNENKHCIILAGSGFLTAGRSLPHLKTLLPNRNNHIIFCGFSGENNLASQIKDGDRFVKVDGDWVENNANITCLYSFSSHASYEELLNYYSKLRYNKIALVHGDIRYKPKFCNTLQDRLHNQGKAAKVVCVNEGTKIYI